MPNVRERAYRAWANAERVKHLSDRLVGVGPVGVGLDGMLAWVPGANLVYTLGAGGVLAYEAVQAGASAATLGRMGLWLAADTMLSGVPVLGWAIDAFFPGHLMAAKALQRDIERRHGRPPAAGPRRSWRFWESAGPFGRRLEPR